MAKQKADKTPKKKRRGTVEIQFYCVCGKNIILRMITDDGKRIFSFPPHLHSVLVFESLCALPISDVFDEQVSRLNGKLKINERMERRQEIRNQKNSSVFAMK